MRFIHTADLHLGYQPDKDFPWGPQRAAAVAGSLSALVDLCVREDVDLLLIAGNLFDHPPVLEECRAADACFQALPRTKVVLVAGPDDFVRPGSTFASYPFAKNVRFLCNDALSSVFFPQWNLEVYGLSYTARTHPEGLPADFSLPDDGRMHVLLANGGDAEHFPLSASLLSTQGWDYAALGGHRSPSISNDGRVAYPGTPEPLGRDETGQHGCFAGSLKKGSFSLYWKPLSSAEYTHLTIHVVPTATQESLEKLIRRRARQDSREILSITLTGERSADVSFDLPALQRQGAIVQVEDVTVPVPASGQEEPAAGKRLREACRTEDGSVSDPVALREGLQALYSAGREPEQSEYDLSARAAALLDLRIREEESLLRPHAQVTAAAMRSELELLERQQLSDDMPRLDSLSTEAEAAAAAAEEARQASAKATDAYRRRKQVLRDMGIESRKDVAEDADCAGALADYLKVYEKDYAAGAPNRVRDTVFSALSAIAAIAAFFRGTIFINDYQYLAAGICLVIAIVLAVVYVRLSRVCDAHSYAKKDIAVLERLLSRYIPDYAPRGTSREAVQLKEFLKKILEIYDYLGDYRAEAEEKEQALADAQAKASGLKAQLEMQRLYIADREQWEARVRECMEALADAQAQIETNQTIMQTVQSLRRAKRVLTQDLIGPREA